MKTLQSFARFQAGLFSLLSLLFSPASSALDTFTQSLLVPGNQWVYRVTDNAGTTTVTRTVLPSMVYFGSTMAYQVSNSDGMIIASALLALVDRWFGFKTPGQFMLELIFYGVICVIPYKIANRSNAARYWYAVITVMSLIASLGLEAPRMSLVSRIGSFRLPDALASAIAMSSATGIRRALASLNIVLTLALFLPSFSSDT